MEYDFKQGELLLIDKPLDWTSFDVVNKIRYTIKKNCDFEGKMKVGHAGTLDPLATGLMIICTGKKTKTIQELTGLDKVYTGTILLGKTTPSYDLETEFDKEYPTAHITEEMIHEVADSFVGEQEQIPPVFSAKKIKGKKAYDMARKGEVVEMKPNMITIHRFKVTAVEMPEVHFEVHCSKGTYIRSLAYDFGKKLESGACLTALRRTHVGDFDIDKALTVDDFVQQVAGKK